MHDTLVDENDFVSQETRWLRPELVASWRWLAAMVTIMLGPGIVIGAAYGLTHATGDFMAMIQDRSFIANGAYEAAMLGLFLLVLHRRGWLPDDLRIRIGWMSTLEGFGLLAASYLGLLATGVVLYALSHLFAHSSWLAAALPKLESLHAGSIHLSWVVIIGFTIVNAFYEELVYMSLLFNQCAARAGVRWAVVATVFARLLIHTYQGTSHAAQIGVWALIFAIGYVRIKRVWPLILAHAMVDLISLSALKLVFG